MQSNILHKTTPMATRLAMLVLLPLLLTQCGNLSPTSQLTSPSNNINQNASANIAIQLDPVATLSKRQAISLKRLVLTLTSPGEDTLRDTTAVTDLTGSTIQKTFNNLKAPQNWTLKAVSYDKLDSIIHSGSTNFATISSETVNVALNLAARFSMLRVSFNGVHDTIAKLSVSIDGATKADTTLSITASPDTVVLSYDYLPATTVGTSHTISLKASGTSASATKVLLSADTTLTVVSGENKVHAIQLKWVGP
jgi:hypothetical protein